MDTASSSTSSRARRFKPRDQTSLQELILTNQVNTNDEELLLPGRGRDGDGDEHNTNDSSSVSSDAQDDSELESMTAKGIKNLCSELLELKNESDEDFRIRIFSNYSVFLRIFGQMEGLEKELTQLKLQASTQKRTIDQLTKTVSLTVLSEETMESVFEESLNDWKSSPSTLEAHTDDVLEILDILLSEHRLDEALSVLEMEARAFQSMHLGESLTSDELMAYNSAISDKRALLVDHLTLLAKNPRISAPELHQALVGICKLGNAHLGLRLLLDYYHVRIVRATRELYSSIAFPHGLAIREVAKNVFSMISQAVRSFVGLHGEAASYAPELIQWTTEQTQAFAAFLTKYVESVSEISGGLSTAVEAVQCALSYCSLLENQKLVLRSCLINYLSPCTERILHIQVDHYKRVISIFTSTDTWIIARYLVSGVLSKGISLTDVDKKLEYCLLTSSGRKFLTLFQDIADECSPLVGLQMEVIVLRELMELFTEYITILEVALTTGKDPIEQNESKIHLADSLIQGVSVIANSFTSIKFFSNIIRSVFGDIDHLKFEIDSYVVFVQETHVQLKAHFCEKVTQKLFSSQGGKTLDAESCISLQNDSDSHHLLPSMPYQEFYLDLRKLQKFAEDSYIEVDWLVGLLRELMEAIFVWNSNREGILTDIEDLSAEENYTSLMQFLLDTQFLEEIARNGGYMSEDVVNASMDIAARIESGLVSAQFSLERYAMDRKWAIDAAITAIQKLEELDETESTTHDMAHNLEDELNECESAYYSDLFENEEHKTSTSHSSESPNLPTVHAAEYIPLEGGIDLEGNGFDDSSVVDCFERFKERLDEIDGNEKHSDNATSSLLDMLLAGEEAPVNAISCLPADTKGAEIGGVNASTSLTLDTDGGINGQQNNNVLNDTEITSADRLEDKEDS